MVKRALTVQIGRVCLINYGPSAGKLCTILDVVDQNRALVDGPASVTGVARQTVNFRSLALTPLTVAVPRSARPSTLAKLLAKANTLAQWNASNWAKKLAHQSAKKQTSDFDRFKAMVAHKKRQSLVNREVAKLKRAKTATISNRDKKRIKKTTAVAAKAVEAEKKRTKEIEKLREVDKAEEKKKKDAAAEAERKSGEQKKEEGGKKGAAAKKKEG